MSYSQQLKRPPKVSTAVKLLYTGLGVGIIRAIIEILFYREKIPAGFVLMVSFFMWIFMGLIIYRISTGHNWARITFLVLFTLGSLSYIQTIFLRLNDEPILVLIGLVAVVIEAIALLLLFQRNSSLWFMAMKDYRSTSLDNCLSHRDAI